MQDLIPDRQHYDLKTKKGVETFMRHFFQAFGLDERWEFAWSRGKKVLGHCNHSRKEVRLSTFAHTHLDEKDIYDTLVHEVAHALTPGAKHGPRWQAMMVRLGQKPDATYRLSDKSEEFRNATEKQYKWVIECPKCNIVVAKYMRKPSSKFDYGQMLHSPCRSPVTYRRIS